MELTRNSSYVRLLRNEGSIFLKPTNTSSLCLPSLILFGSYTYTAFGSAADHEYFWCTLILILASYHRCREDRKRRHFFPLSNTNQAQERNPDSTSTNLISCPLGLDDDLRLFSSFTGQLISLDPFSKTAHSDSTRLFTGVTRLALITNRRLDAGSSCDVSRKLPLSSP